MEMIHHQLLEISESSQIADTRRKAIALCEQVGLSEVRTGEVAIVVTELATNLLKHAGKGRMLMRLLHESDPQPNVGIEILSLDSGPGVSNFQRCFEDGFTTSGSQGTGLGAVKRLSHRLQTHSAPGAGTVVWSQLWQQPPSPQKYTLQTGVICVPKHGQTVCGDGWGIRFFSEGALLLVLDGLGHGLMAHDASRKAEEIFHSHPHPTPDSLLQAMHQGLKKFRGAAGAITLIKPSGEILYAGIGNITAFLETAEKKRHMVSHNGALGVNVRQVRNFEYRTFAGDHLVMFSDGLATRVSLEGYSNLQELHPTLVAAMIYRDFTRDTDDATVMVVRL